MERLSGHLEGDVKDPIKLLSVLDDTKLAVLRYLKEPMRQADLAQKFDNQRVIYHAVAVLWGAGWLTKRKETAVEVYYQVDQKAVLAVLRWFEASLNGN